jgi:hypothetical protein
MSNNIPMRVASFDQWKACGYAIRFGQKAKFRNLDGISLFTEEQVCRPVKGWQPLIEDPLEVK